MQVSTGAYVPLDPRLDDRAALLLAAAELEADVDDVVLIRGELQAVQQVGERVRLGNAELERRRKRRAQQADSRRKNRPS